MKAMVINGEFPGMPQEGTWEKSTRYAVSYIVDSSVEKLYTFTVTPLVLQQLKEIADGYRRRFIGHTFKSLEIVDNL
jgi:DNA repair protein RecO (recombination protein O)